MSSPPTEQDEDAPKLDEAQIIEVMALVAHDVATEIAHWHTNMLAQRQRAGAARRGGLCECDT